MFFDLIKGMGQLNDLVKVDYFSLCNQYSSMQYYVHVCSYMYVHVHVVYMLSIINLFSCECWAGSCHIISYTPSDDAYRQWERNSAPFLQRPDH